MQHEVNTIWSNEKNPSAFGVTETVPQWMNLKDSSTLRPSLSEDSDYMYHYVDYPDNMSDTSASTSPSIVSTVSLPTQTVKIIHPPSQTRKNVTSAGTRDPTTPPPPSHSSIDFTVFDFPLFKWVHPNRKAERKESSFASYRSDHRGRNRSFPPTEPEIHRGGFEPLPRAESGFKPIPDPRLLLYERHENTSRSNGTAAPREGRPRKNGNNSSNNNNTVIRVEKTVAGPIGKARTKFREKEQVSTAASILDRSADRSAFEPRKMSANINRTR